MIALICYSKWFIIFILLHLNKLKIFDLLTNIYTILIYVIGNRNTFTNDIQKNVNFIIL